jgi:hypothetical protein
MRNMLSAYDPKTSDGPYGAGTTAYKVELNYDLSDLNIHGLKLHGEYTTYDKKDEDEKSKVMLMGMHYTVPKAEHIGVDVKYSTVENDFFQKKDRDIMRVVVDYEF